MPIDNIEQTGIVNIFSELVEPFSEARPFYFPTFTRINNVEQS